MLDRPRPLRVNTGRIVHVVVTAFFALGTLLLVYETIALARPQDLQPITAYVRCANQDAPAATFAAAVAVSFLLGRWISPPRRRRS